MGVIADRAAGFLSLRGRKLGFERWTEQLALWSAALDVGAHSGTYEFSPGTFR
jgi:hypothetical protein